MKIKNEKGFTLIEMMIVLVIITIVSGLSISAYFANLPHLRLVSATRDFVNNIRLAQQIAAKENRTVRLTLRSTTNYEIVRITGNQDPVCAPLVDDVNIKTVDIGEEYKKAVQIGGSDPCDSLVFGKLGALESTASSFTFAAAADANCPSEFVVNLQRADGTETKMICINSAGRIRIP